MPRKNTVRILEMVEEGILDPQQVMLAALNYLSDSEVFDMARANEFGLDDDDEDDDDDDERSLEDLLRMDGEDMTDEEYERVCDYG